MIEYLLIDESGTIRQRGRCSDPVDIPHVEGWATEVIDRADPRRPVEGPPPTYREYRHMDYPPVGDQLDVLWRFVESLGPLTGDAAAMAAKIKSVKSKWPKE